MDPQRRVNEPHPETMWVLELTDYGQPPRMAARPIPEPGPGEVLIRMAAAPINPSDLGVLLGSYGSPQPLPTVLGFEGSGTVVAAGPGLLARQRLGKAVAAAATLPGSGTWAQYLLTEARSCLPLGPAITLEQGATMIINPVTAWVLVAMARRGRHRAIVNTAAASALGRMILRLDQRFELPVVHVVRRPEHLELLRSLGAEHVLDSSQADFEAQLRDSVQRLGATLAFDAVAGEMSGQLLEALPAGGRLVIYGGMSQQPPTVATAPFVSGGKRLEGFLLSRWLAAKNPLVVLRIAAKVRSLLPSDLSTHIRQRVPLEGIAAALESYVDTMSEGKILLTPNADPADSQPA